MCDCPRIGGVKTRPETERQAIERLDDARLRRQVAEARAEGEAARTAEIVAWLRATAHPRDAAFAHGALHSGDVADEIAAHFNPKAKRRP